MRHAILPVLAVLPLILAPGNAFAGNPVHYVSCRADNESDSATYGLDEATKRVCDHAVGSKWFVPSEFDANVVEWSDSSSTKIIYRSGKHKHYEHNILLLNHLGHCNKTAAPSTPPCTG
jgi:hypothetical protein